MAYIHIENDHYSPEKIKIERDNKDFPNTVSVVNSQGTTIFTCTQEWSDEQIIESMKLAFRAFNLGKMRGAGDSFDQMKDYAEDKKQCITLG